MIRSILRRQPFLAFAVLAFAWTWPLAAGGPRSLAFPLLALFGPLVAAVVVIGACKGRAGLARLVGRFAVRRAHAPWLAIAILVPALLVVAAWALHLWWHGPVPLVYARIGVVDLVVAALIVGEEVGWRGFALPHLLERYPVRASAIVVGLLWAAWHIPNFLTPGYPHFGMPFAPFAVLVTAYSVLFTWLFLRTGGNLTVAVAFHAVLNLFTLGGVDPDRRQELQVATYVTAALVCMLAGGLRRMGGVPSARAAAPQRLVLRLLTGRYAVARESPQARTPAWAEGAGAGADTDTGIVSVTRTAEELSVVCAEDRVPGGVRAERGFRVLAVRGPLDFALTGVIASLTTPLARAGVSVFVVSTFDTDLLLVREADLESAIRVLEAAGHEVRQ
ncbi:MAG: ACT domain-containing protein [Candidatus Eiseniibacteriota bacterium]